MLRERPQPGRGGEHSVPACPLGSAPAFLPEEPQVRSGYSLRERESCAPKQLGGGKSVIQLFIKVT